MFHFPFLSSVDDFWAPADHESGGCEDRLLQAIVNHQVDGNDVESIGRVTVSNMSLSAQTQVDGVCFKETILSVDWFHCAGFLMPLVWYYGNLSAVDLWLEKALPALQEINLRASRDYAHFTGELEWNLNMVVPFLLSLGYREGAASILEAFGFTWDKDGFDCIESSGVACRHSFQFIDKGACC